jgi:urea transport system ATP-binding protein
VIEILRAEGEMSIVLVEQYFDFAVRLADRFVVMNRGEVSYRTEKAALDREKLLASVSI